VVGARWSVERVRAPAAELHAWDPGEPAGRVVRICDVTGPAIVLGSAQPDTVDRAAAAAAGVAVVRRRSGGGAVLVAPGDPVWVDLVIPSGDPLWDDDVGAAFAWVGRVWTAALARLGLVAQAHEGPLVRTELSPAVCFAGLGPGEIVVGGRKSVGISQRRTRSMAWFQCAALRSWDPAPLCRLLGVEAAALADAAAGLPVPPDALVDAVLAALPG
jgi:lipoate-protein ligase A